MLMSLCTCVHKIYVRILYIFQLFKQKKQETTKPKLNCSGLREGAVNMGSPVRGDHNQTSML